MPLRSGPNHMLPGDRRLHFANFELDVRTRELFKAGQRVRVPDQSIQVLLALVEQPGGLVSRQELRARLWPADRFVDFEHGLNAAVRRLRDALGDSAGAPRFIETLPKRGYRFIGTLAPDVTEPAAPRVPADRAEILDTAQHPLLLPFDQTAESISKIAQAVPSSGHPEVVRKTRRTGQLLGVTVLVLIGLSAPASQLVRRDVRSSAPFEPALERLTFEPGLQTDPSLSPDGSLIAFSADTAGNFDIWIQPVGGGNPRQVTTDPAHDWQPDWSPDGSELVFRSERDGGGIFVVAASGGQPHRLTTFGYRPRWSPDGAHIAFVETIFRGQSQDLHVVERSGGRPISLPLRSLDPGDRLASFAWQPARGAVAVLGGENPDPLSLLTIDPVKGIVQRWQVDPDVQRAFSEQRLRVVRSEAFAWDRTSDTIYFVADSRGLVNVWSVKADSRARRLIAGPHRVTTNQDAAASVSVSRDGRRLLFGTAVQSAQIWLATLNGDGTELSGDARFLTPDTVDAYSPELSLDGAQLAYLREHPGNGQGRELILHSLHQGTDRVLCVDAVDRGEVRGPPLRWSRDASRLLYRYVLPDSPLGPDESRPFKSLQQIRIFDVRNGRESDVTSPAAINDVPFGWSLDGRDVFSTGARYREGESVIARLRIGEAPHAERSAQLITGTRQESLWQASVSPNGRWILFQLTGDDYSRSRIAVAASSGAARRDITDGSRWMDKPRWSDRGTIIYYISDRDGLFNVWAQPFDPVDGVPVGTRHALTHFNGPGEQILPDVSKDEISIHAGRIVIPVIRPRGAVWMLDGLQPDAQFASTIR